MSEEKKELQNNREQVQIGKSQISGVNKTDSPSFIDFSTLAKTMEEQKTNKKGPFDLWMEQNNKVDQ